MEQATKPLVLTREFDSKIEKVWEAWTDEKQFAQWWSPDGFLIPLCELDVRVGGEIRVNMQGPDGTIYPSRGKYLEVERPSRLVFMSTPTDNDGKVLFEVKQTVELSEAGDKTKLHLTAEVVSATTDAAPHLAGMEQGMKMAFDKLARLV